MKTNNTKKNSATKKLIPAVSMLTVSAMMLSTATYAWFTMSRTVKVDGMEVKTKVSGNLLISDTNTSDEYYGTQLKQTKKALLEPVSSIKGVDDTFWYTLDAAADGHKLRDTTTDAYKDYETDFSNTTGVSSGYANTFSENYAITSATAAGINDGMENDNSAYGYVDYVFYLKATPDAENNFIKMTKCNLSYNGAEIGSDQLAKDKAWRIAVFAESTTAATTSATPSSAVGKLIGGNPLGLTGASYFDGKAVTSATAKDTASTTNSGIVLNSTALTAGTPAYYKVVVRMWLEGEDPTCKTENYMTLDNAWALDLQFDLVPTGEGTAVTTIGTSAPATVTDDVPRAATP